MPPKTEITKEKIQEAAFELVRNQGIELLTARHIAKMLNCSTQPIYSTYGNMDEVRNDVFDRIVDHVITSMKKYENERNAPAMNWVIGCLLFAHQERHLFRTLFLSDYREAYLKKNQDRLNEELYIAFLQIDDRLTMLHEETVRRIFRKIMAYWLGISTMINTNTMAMDIDEATAMIEEMYKALTIKEGLTW